MILTGHLAGYLSGAEPRYRDHPELAGAPALGTDAPDLGDALPPVAEQVAQDCCAHAVSGLTYNLARKIGPRLPWDDKPSVLALYGGAVVRARPLEPPADNGSTLVHMFAHMAEDGIVPESAWPELPSNVGQVPPDRVWRRAAEVTLSRSHKLADGRDSAKEILLALRNLRCTTLCMIWDDAAANVGKSVLMSPGGKVWGSHCVLVYKYVPQLRAFGCRNSHGLSFGDQGDFLLHEDFVNRLTYEKFTADVGPTVLP